MQRSRAFSNPLLGFSTAIDFENCSASLELAMSVHEDFRLSKIEALEIIERVRNSVQNWNKVAIEIGLSRFERDQMASAFKLD